MSETPPVVATPEAPAARLEKGRRRLQRLTKRDKVVLAFMVGIPVLIELALIWMPTVASVGLSFTKWNGLAIGDIKGAGFGNYSYIFNDYPQFWPAVRHNILWLLFLGIIATPLGLLLAVLLDQRLRGSRIYQTVFFVPVMLSLALVGIIWKLMYSPADGLIDSLMGLVVAQQGRGPARRDRLARRSEHQHLVGPDRRDVETRRLHHDLVLGRA